MTKSPIILGIIGKKIYLTLLLALIISLNNILKKLISQGNSVSYINSFGGSLLQMLSVFIPYIFKFQGRAKISIINCSKNIIIDYSIFLVIYLIIIGMNKLFAYLNIQAFSLSEIYIGKCFQIIFYIILSIIILKSKYYIHHYISLILFCMFTIINDIILGNLKYITLSSFLLLVPILVEDLLCCYLKYLVDKKYHFYWNILFFSGLFTFIDNIIEFSIIVGKDPYNNLFSNLLEMVKKNILF